MTIGFFGRTQKPHRKLHSRWMIGVLGLLFALLPLIQAGSVAARPHITEFQAPGRDFIGQVQGITAGSDGALWFTNVSNVIGRITTKGVITTTQLPSFQFNAQEITSGPDKALWFTLPNSVPGNTSAEIGRLTTAGKFTGFKIPFESIPSDITSGTDGNLYFTDLLKASIDLITLQGKFKQFPFHGGNNESANSITVGPDGNLWFTDLNSGRIGKMTTSGQFTFFPVPGAQRGEHGGLLDGITSGRDGNLWFTIDGFSGNKSLPQVGRITPAGKITEFPLPIPGSDNVLVSGIATGSDGNLWFTYSVGDQFGHLVMGDIGRIKPSGKFSLFPTPSQPSFPIGITSGPDSNLWFTEETQGGLGNAVGNVTTH